MDKQATSSEGLHSAPISNGQGYGDSSNCLGGSGSQAVLSSKQVLSIMQ